MGMRTIQWTVAKDCMSVSPTRHLDGGVQGDHNVTRAEFSLPAPLLTGYTLYIEYVDVCGNYDKTESLTVEDGKVGTPIPLAWTQHGGEGTLRLVATKSEGEIDTETGYTLEGKVRYHSRSGLVGKVDRLIKGCLQAMMDEIRATTERLKIFSVGRTTENGGEIFNDYDNNQAGTMVFKIVGYSVENKSLTLDSAEGLTVDMECSMSIGNNYDFFGKITGIAGTVVTFDTFPVSSITITDNCVLWVPRHPELGTTGGWGDHASARGYNTIAARAGSSAEGCGTVAGGKYAHAEGVETLAGFAAHAEGRGSKAMNVSSHAEGENTVAKGLYAHAEGRGTVAQGNASHAEGDNTLAEKNYTHAEGTSTKAIGDYAHSEGAGTTASGIAAHAEGQGSAASGLAAHAEGQITKAQGAYAHAEGYNTTASMECAHAEGYESKASGNYSHAEGLYNTASGAYSHAEGRNTTASNNTAHAEGFKTVAAGQHSHAGGSNTSAGHTASFAHGTDLYTAAENQAVFGRHNKVNENALFQIGNGAPNGFISNAFEVLADGSGIIQAQGDAENSLVQKKYVDNTLKFAAPNIVDGQWYLGEEPTGTPATGDSGAPKVQMCAPSIVYDEAYGTLLMEDNVEYRFTSALNYFTLAGFYRQNIGEFSPMWSVMFQTGNYISVSITDQIVWAVAEPVFEPNRTYWLSFVECGEKYLGVWSVV